MTGSGEPIDRRRVLLATVTPLASIFGSGFLIIVPVLERTLGALSILGVIAVCALSWMVGTAIRHCVRVVEPLAGRGDLDVITARLERGADAVIVVAYVISVALYLRIMAEYVVGFVAEGRSTAAERILACATVALIVGVGVKRGFHGLDLLERVALAAVLVLTTLLGGALLIDDGRQRWSAQSDLGAATACRELKTGERLDGHRVGGDSLDAAEHHLDLPLAQQGAGSGVKSRQVGANKRSPDLEDECARRSAAHGRLEPEFRRRPRR